MHQGVQMAAGAAGQVGDVVGAQLQALQSQKQSNCAVHAEQPPTPG
jgi:hypothetical protein